MYLVSIGAFMEKPSRAEKLLIEEIAQSAKQLHQVIRGLKIGEFIKLIRNQLKMSQKALARRAGIPPSTVSRTEQSQNKPTLTILLKIFDALSCNLVVAPMLKEPIDTIRYRQAKRIAEQHIQYLKGTMNLEQQKPDQKLLEELIKQEVEELLHGSGARLWE